MKPQLSLTCCRQISIGECFTIDTNTIRTRIVILVLLILLMSSIPAHAGLTRTQVSELYVTIFGRASEGEGNTYWQSQPDMATAAAAMLDTPAAKNYFGSSLDTDQAFIEHIYINTLNKTMANDPTGIAYWVGMLNAGSTRGEVVGFPD